MGKPVVRNAERQAFCRSCDCTMEKGTPMVSLYSFRNQGMWIHLCIQCSVDIGRLGCAHLLGEDEL